MVDFPSFFWANDPNVNAQLRQRIALSLLSGKKGFPKNIGEGLTAIGDAIGDYGIMRRLEALDRSQQDQARDVLNGPGAATPPSAPQRTAYAPFDDNPKDGSPSTTAQPAVTPTASDDTSPPPRPGDSNLTTASVQPASVLSPTMAGGLTAPQATRADLRSPQLPPGSQGPAPSSLATGTGPGDVRDGSYNEIDAQAGFKRTTPGYIQDAIARNVADPDMRAYLGSLVGGEAPKGPNQVSSTGAAGPFQFVPGTARQYGLSDPTNLDASVQAAQRLTADNAAQFQRINGRPPTMAEMAVMHQQGGRTGANMVAGTGNASPRNLALNNVNPAASPAQAVNAIKNYYGMPDRTVGGDPRAAVADALAGQQQKPPVMAFDGTPDATFNASNFLPVPPQQAIQKAPPATPPLQQAPPGQATQSSAPIMPALREPPMPGNVPMSPREVELRRLVQQFPNNPYVAQRAALELEQLKAAREATQTQQLEQYKERLRLYNTLQAKRQDQTFDAPLREQQVQELKNKNKHGTHVVVEGRLMMPDPNAPAGAPWIDVTAKMPGTQDGGPPQVKLTAEQSKEIKFLQQMYTASAQLKGKEQLLAQGLADELKGKVPFVGNALMQRDYNMAKRAAEFWTAANLRDISGAVIGAQEHTNQMRMLMPQYGDGPRQLREKAARRQAIEDGMYAGLGNGQQVADWWKKKIYNEQAQEQSKINGQMSHIQNPAKGQVSVNRKTGERRVFDGKNWLEE